MQYFMQNPDYSSYLGEDETIDFSDPRIRFVAAYLMEQTMTSVTESSAKDVLPDPEMQLARITYHYVRDRIAHSFDTGARDVTIKASDVLVRKHGLCYAKSHLLAALLRANGIPTGFCYQYLRLDGDDSDLVIHGLNAVYFESIGRWVRLDARGNKDKVDAGFSVEEERLAFPVRPWLGETDLPMIHATPDRAVLVTLRKYADTEALRANLPRKIAGK